MIPQCERLPMTDVLGRCADIRATDDESMRQNAQPVAVRVVERFLEYSERNRVPVLIYAALMIAAILVADWNITDRSFGFLYIIPILLISATLSNAQVVVLAAIFSILREHFTPGHWGSGAVFRILTGFAGFTLAGFFVSELNRERRLVLRHRELGDEQARLRQDAEQQMRILIDTSPLAIFTVDGGGHIRLANLSAHDLLGFTGDSLNGAEIGPYLPILNRLMRTTAADGALRTVLECKGQRRNGEVFLAHIWLSTWMTSGGRRLAAVVWDSSDNVRTREDSGLDSMMAVSRVLVGAVSHEIRNLASAGLAAHQHLGTLPGADVSEDYRALGAIMQGLEKISASGLRAAARRTAAVAEPSAVLDETRIIIEESIAEAGGSIRWRIANHLPLVQIDQHNLLQVFLNLARNCERALEQSTRKELDIEARREGDLVQVRFTDSGPGVRDPEQLFRPFQAGAHASGLGLYISRAILRASGGDLRYEPRSSGACFVVELWPAEDEEE